MSNAGNVSNAVYYLLCKNRLKAADKYRNIYKLYHSQFYHFGRIMNNVEKIALIDKYK